MQEKCPLAGARYSQSHVHIPRSRRCWTKATKADKYAELQNDYTANKQGNGAL